MMITHPDDILTTEMEKEDIKSFQEYLEADTGYKVIKGWLFTKYLDWQALSQASDGFTEDELMAWLGE